MCFPFEGNEEDRTIGPRPSAGPQLTINRDRDLSPDDLIEQEEIATERERRTRQIRDLGSIFDTLGRGATSPFGVFGPRLGVESISDVRPGERGRSVTIADLKRGL